MMIGDGAGCRILVVEDETFIAMLIEDVLKAIGCDVIGPTGKLETALQLASDAALDAAILDVSIRGGKIYPVAERLLARDIPFVLSSGYNDRALPENLRNKPRLIKPFTTAQLEEKIMYLCGEIAKR